MPQKPLSYRILSENKYWFKNSPQQELFLYFELEGGPAPENQSRIPLNISLVVDRSGSMAGQKLSYVKKAVDFVIDNLNQDDILSIVQYDDTVEVVSPSTKVNNKSDLHRKVQQIQERGMTNLSGGMLEGYSQVKSTARDGLVNRVLLLSDGLANRGITEASQLQGIAQKKFREERIGLSTFGVGSDFNELLMTNLSEYGGANYYFIDMPDKIPQIFAKELEGLLAVIAQNCSFELKFDEKILRCEKVYGYPFTVQNNRLKINFNDVFAEEKKAVLMKFTVLKPIQEGLSFDWSLAYDDVVHTYAKVQESGNIVIQSSQQESEYKAGMNQVVMEQVALFVSNDMLEEAMLKADQRDIEGAKKITAQTKTYLDTYFKMIVPSEELKKQYQTILNYEQQLDQMKEMTQSDFMMTQKVSRSTNYGLRKKKGS